MTDERLPWMNDAQAECYRMLCDMMGGSHRFRSPVRSATDHGIYVNLPLCDLSTCDGNRLTVAIFMAHDRAIRLELDGYGGPGRIRIYLHKRQREGRTYERHPSIETALADYRALWPEVKP